MRVPFDDKASRTRVASGDSAQRFTCALEAEPEQVGGSLA